jgi:hypothetical protein
LKQEPVFDESSHPLPRSADSWKKDSSEHAQGQYSKRLSAKYHRPTSGLAKQMINV